MQKYARLTLAVLLTAWSAIPAAAAARDAIDLSQAVYHNSPNVSTWAKTTAITRVVMQPEGAAAPGLSLEFSARNTWPDYTPPGWDGPIQYTVWAGVNIGGVWHVSGIIQMWRSRDATGAPLLTYGPGCAVNNFACNWVYDGRWGTMAGYQPRAGEAMVFFVTAGNARGTNTVTSWAERSNVVMINLPANDTGVFTFPANALTTAGDFDGDGKSDFTVFRPSTGYWYSRLSRYNAGAGVLWGGGADIPVPGDYDGDGLTDVGVFRPSTSTWYLRRSTGAPFSGVWGGAGDLPVQSDYDGDGKTDIAVFRPSSGTWYIGYSAGGGAALVWGGNGDVPIPADYDGDGRADIAVFRPSNVTFYIRLSSTGALASVVWGLSTDVPVPGDYDGDGRADLALYRASTGSWFIGYTGSQTGAAFQFGGGTDIPVPGDYNGDGRTDIAVYRPSNGTWYWGGGGTQWGDAADYPILRR